MKNASLLKNVEYKENGPAVMVLFETENTKEIRIAFRKGQLMKEHKAPFPIVVEIFEGEIDFGVEGETQILERGDLIALDGNVPHNLKAEADSIVRLTLNKRDDSQRVREAANE